MMRSVYKTEPHQIGDELASFLTMRYFQSRMDLRMLTHRSLGLKAN